MAQQDQFAMAVEELASRKTTSVLNSPDASVPPAELVERISLEDSTGNDSQRESPTEGASTFEYSLRRSTAWLDDDPQYN